MKKKLFIIFIISILFISGCSDKKPTENPIVTMTIKDYGDIKIELYPDIAPNTVANFVNLTEKGFYDNNTIHRVQKGFVIQGGDPTGTGSGGPGYTIKGEFAANGIENDLKHTRGVISMARGDKKNSAGCQFFIMLGDADYLDGQYAAFGKIIEGMEVIENIENTDFEITNSYLGVIKTPLTIEKTTVDTKGFNYKVKKIMA